MIVRGLDSDGDFLFGKGRNDYKSANKAVAQCIQTRLFSFLGDCFFATDAGLDWWNILGAKNRIELQLQVNVTILNTPDVTKLVSSEINLSTNRHITLTYTVETVHTNVSGENAITASTSFLLTEGGDVLITEDGEGIEGG